jgi:hypothetical protein
VAVAEFDVGQVGDLEEAEQLLLLLAAHQDGERLGLPARGRPAQLDLLLADVLREPTTTWKSSKSLCLLARSLCGGRVFSLSLNE